MTHTDTDIAEILKRFRENCNKTFWKGGFIDDNDDTFRIESIEDFITRECLALKKKWEKKHTCTHTEIEYDCPCWHDGYETGNSEPPLSEQKKWEREHFDNQ